MRDLIVQHDSILVITSLFAFVGVISTLAIGVIFASLLVGKAIAEDGQRPQS